MTPKEKAKLADKCLVELMKSNPTQVIMWMLVQLGKEMIEANAETLDISQESTLNKTRYKIICNCKLKKL